MDKNTLTTLAKRLRPFLISVAHSVVQNDLSAGEGPGIDIINSLIGLGGDTILIYFANGIPVAEYNATDAGLDSAGAAVGAASDRIFIPPCVVLSAAHALAGCEYIFPSGLVVGGKLTTAPGTKIFNLNLGISGNSASPVIGIEGPASGEAHLYDCRIVPVNSGAGGVNAVYVNNYGDLICHNCYLDGRAANGGGNGYAAYRNPASGGNIRIEGGTALGSSADNPFNE